MKKIALDVDGVLLNYRQAYARRWKKAFGYLPEIKDPNAYEITEHLDIRVLDRAEQDHMNSFGTEEFWSTMAPMPKAKEACYILSDAGYELHAVTAAAPKTQAWRESNLRELGFPITSVTCVGGGKSPKAVLLNEMMPEYFVDDFIGYFDGVDPDIKWVLINSPRNLPHPRVQEHHMYHVVNSLSDFARNFLGQPRQ